MATATARWFVIPRKAASVASSSKPTVASPEDPTGQL